MDNYEYDEDYTDEVDMDNPYDRYWSLYLMRALHGNAEGLTVAEAEDGMNTALEIIRLSLMNGISEYEPEFLINIRVDAMATIGYGARWYRTQWRRLVNEHFGEMLN